MYRQPADVLPSSSPLSSANATPSSSPVFGPVDSSPPSSPSHTPYSLDSPPQPTSAPFSHPFAASTKATKPLPKYEKKVDSPPCTPPGVFTRAMPGRLGPSRSLQEEDYMDDPFLSATPPSHRTWRYLYSEERIWDDALRKPFDTGIGQIDLSDHELRYIPPSIADLAGFFNTPELSEQRLLTGRMFARINTEPPVDGARTRSFERTQSIKDSGKERHVLKLYLMGNMITSLPPELFSVKNLTVLSLRGNRLTFIPPDICRLTHLRELNISNNQVRFLPWQMREMKIEVLLLNPNPFLPEPPPLPPAASSPRARRSLTRIHSRRDALSSTKPVLSSVTRPRSRVPSLTELCLRCLLAPSDVYPSQTVLAAYYGLPISDDWCVPPNVRHTLMDAAPGCIRPRRRCSVDTLGVDDRARPCAAAGTGTGMGACPNPAHKGRVFVRHWSERFSWGRRIAGVDVGGAVPLRWQGCLWNCLDFLDEERKVPEGNGRDREEAECTPKLAVGGGGGGDIDIDMEFAVQAVDLGSTSLDMDDFDD